MARGWIFDFYRSPKSHWSQQNIIMVYILPGLMKPHPSVNLCGSQHNLFLFLFLSFFCFQFWDQDNQNEPRTFVLAYFSFSFFHVKYMTNLQNKMLTFQWFNKYSIRYKIWTSWMFYSWSSLSSGTVWGTSDDSRLG